ncbi:hypothetical protein DXH95_14340 [Sphingorhabdus pulchriflava]|uniref:Oligosaccharide repeat unit polymerase n=1 Tax=Sphingorhabdus pulchriflava TaxID=2292257 RepID=A0A371B1Z0_9SPHN|nr:hypothetical protein [Sphingorhabdus pulchriflava]RDV01471.1 hypothetical protein DXH95_14340 [Sphingorhabdus pulchriflava]
MMRLIFMTQAVLYLLLMPTLHDYMNPMYRPPLIYAYVAVGALIAGFFFSNRVNQRSAPAVPQQREINLSELEPRSFVVVGFAVLAVMYAYVSWTNGLLNRRQGSEMMAEIYGSLPLQELIILRVYEIAFIPVAIIFFFGRARAAVRLFVAFVLLVSLPFMGIEDSRARLLVMAIFVLCFVNIKDFIKFFYKNAKIYIAIFVAAGVFVYVSLQRLSSYARFEDFLFYEIVRRLDGMNILTELHDYGYIKYLGTFDAGMFGPLVSRIPFLEAGRLAKLEGITSTKQYFLNTILNSNRIDDSNSLILDPLYFAGIPGLIISFFALGYYISRFDSYVIEKKIFSSHIKLTIVLAFVTSFAIFEVDYFGAITTFIQNFLIIWILTLIVLNRPSRYIYNSKQPVIQPIH